MGPDEEDETRELRDCVRSLLAAQKRRAEAVENGEYELDAGEGFECRNCGWQGIWAPGVEDETACPECDSPDLSLPEQTVERYQQFGYEFTAFPADIPQGEEDAYRRDSR